MNLGDNSIYKFERKTSSKDAYQFKVTTELLEDLENTHTINEVIINIDEKTGTLTVPLKNNLSKVFNLNIETITRGEMESLEMNMFRPNKTVESIAHLNVRVNVQATSKVYDMTKKKIVEIEDENKKHCAKELKLPCSNKNSLSYKVFQNNETLKTESIPLNQDQKKISLSVASNKISHTENKKAPQFTIREKLVHLLALKPSSKDSILLGLHKLGVTSTDRSEVEKQLHQVSTLTKDGIYQLSNQVLTEIRDDWHYFNDDSRKRLLKLKSSQINNVSHAKHSIQRESLICNDNTDRNFVIKDSVMSQSKNTDQSTISSGKNIVNTTQTVKVQERTNNFQKVCETTRKTDRKKQIVMSPKSNRSGRQDTISPAESNSSSKTINSNDEGFVSGDKRSPLKLPYGSNPNKRHSQHLSNNSTDNSARKMIHLSDKNSTLSQSRNDLNSSSSCDVTPTSDVSHSSNIFRSNDSKLDFNISDINGPIKINDTDNDGTQARFNIAFEEYSKLCSKLKEREDEVEKLRSSCKNAKSSDYARMYKIAKSLLDQMETPQFLEIIARVKTLESEMCDYVRILTGQQLN